MFAPSFNLDSAICFSRFDCEHPLASCSPQPIFLEDTNWLTAEHYVQAKLVRSEALAKQILHAPSGLDAHKLGSAWWRAKIPEWKARRRLLMTRALYTKVQMYEDVREFLLNTGDHVLIETSAYDHYWGLGRDQRGQNTFGVVWMDIRAKLRQSHDSHS